MTNSVAPQNSAFVDTLTFSLPNTAILGGFSCDDDFDRQRCVAFFNSFLEPLGFRVGYGLGNGKNFYQTAYWLEFANGLEIPAISSIGFVAFGGNNGTACVYFSGFACSSLTMSGLFPVVRKMLETYSAKITRIDCTFDCFEGEYTVDDAVAWWQAGLWKTAGGKPSKYCCHGQWLPGDMRERTFEVGSRQSTKFVRIYEKGHQLGDYDSQWTRWEIQYNTANGAHLPYDMLTNPGHYLSTAYECFSWIPSNPTTSESVTYANKKKAKLTVQQYKNHVRLQYGKFISTMVELGFSVDRLFDEMSRQGIPSRLIVPPIYTVDSRPDNTAPF